MRKHLGHEADHSPPSSTKIKNAWNYNSTATYTSMTWCLIKGRDNFTFLTFIKSPGYQYEEFNIPNVVQYKKRAAIFQKMTKIHIL
jgi:hypothetical protein